MPWAPAKRVDGVMPNATRSGLPARCVGQLAWYVRGLLMRSDGCPIGSPILLWGQQLGRQGIRISRGLDAISIQVIPFILITLFISSSDTVKLMQRLQKN